MMCNDDTHVRDVAEAMMVFDALPPSEQEKFIAYLRGALHQGCNAAEEAV